MCSTTSNEHRAQLLGGLRVGLLFGDGRGDQVDFTQLIDSDLPPVFAALRDPQTFSSFERVHGTLHWQCEPDLAPEYLYFRAFAHDPSLHKQFVEWGYLQLETIHA